jgi:hypothetical protein
MSDRRNFIKGSAAVGAAALAQGILADNVVAAGPGHAANRNPGPEMTRGLTLCNYQDGVVTKLGVRTDRGMLQVDKAARALKMKAPLTTDDVLQNGDQGLTKLVAAARSKDSSSWYVPVVDNAARSSSFAAHPVRAL